MVQVHEITAVAPEEAVPQPALQRLQPVVVIEDRTVRLMDIDLPAQDLTIGDPVQRDDLPGASPLNQQTPGLPAVKSLQRPVQRPAEPGVGSGGLSR